MKDETDDDPENILNSANYWIIAPYTVEGLYLAQKIMKKFFFGVKAPDKHVLVVVEPDGNPVYYFRRKLMTAKQLSSIVGSTPEKLSSAKIVRLRIKQDLSLPQPTVNYWGEA